MTNSDRRRWIEILAVVLTGGLKYVLVDWLNFRIFYIMAACLSWIIYILSRYRHDRNTLQRWGFRKENFKRSFLFILPFALLTIGGILWYGLHFHRNFLNWHVIPILFLYPLWGMIQQFMMTALIAGNLLAAGNLNIGKYRVILITSLLFSMAHFPYLSLMVYAFFMEILFTFTYFKWRNLWPLGLFHGWVSGLLLFFVLGRDLWSELWKIF